MTTPAKSTSKPAALTFPVPGELGAILREAGYEAELVIRRADGRDPMASERDALPMVLAAVEATDAAGRGASLRMEVGARSVVSGPANRGTTARKLPAAKSKPRGKRAAAKVPGR